MREYVMAVRLSVCPSYYDRLVDPRIFTVISSVNQTNAVDWPIVEGHTCIDKGSLSTSGLAEVQILFFCGTPTMIGLILLE